MKPDHYLFTEKTNWHELGHKVVQRVCFFACGFMFAYFVWGPK